MDLKKNLLAGISGTALVVAASAGAWADNVIDGKVDDNARSNSQDVEIGSDNGDGSGGGNGFNDSNAVAVAQLQQNAVQIVASEDEEAIDDYVGDMDFGSRTFQNQELNNNNFNTGVNAVQGNASAIACAAVSSPCASACATAISAPFAPFAVAGWKSCKWPTPTTVGRSRCRSRQPAAACGCSR